MCLQNVPPTHWQSHSRNCFHAGVLCVWLVFFSFLTKFPQHVSHRALCFPPDTIRTLSACFAMWQSLKQLAVTGSSRCFSTPAKQNLFPSCRQPGITLARKSLHELKFLYHFITLKFHFFLCKALIWNQVWPKPEHVFREGVSTAVQEGNLISFAELGGLVLHRVVCQHNPKHQRCKHGLGKWGLIQSLLEPMQNNT